MSAPGGRADGGQPFGFPPTLAVLLSIVSIQGGAALAKSLFPLLGPFGTSALRIGFSALILLAVWRPDVRRLSRADLGAALLFGLSLGLMNLSFYAAIQRIPLGVAVTLEFVGPLSLAVFGSRRPADFLWAALAGLGIVLISPFGSGGAERLDPLGAGLALLAGALWAAYIVVGGRIGRRFAGGQGLALAMTVSALIALPIGAVQAGAALLAPSVLALGLLVAVLSSALPYSLEMVALRRIPARTFSILMSLEPAAAALAGLLFLGEALGLRQVVAMALVIAASVGTSLGARAGGDAP